MNLRKAWDLAFKTGLNDKQTTAVIDVINEARAEERLKLRDKLNDRICVERRDYGTDCGHTTCYHLEEIVYELEQAAKP